MLCYRNITGNPNKSNTSLNTIIQRIVLTSLLTDKHTCSETTKPRSAGRHLLSPTSSGQRLAQVLGFISSACGRLIDARKIKLSKYVKVFQLT